MTDKYTAWIAADVAAHNGWTRGRCQGAASRMVEAFPELRLVRGYCVLTTGWQPAHWWCETPDGQVVDPTAAQFEEAGIERYDEYDEKKHGPLPFSKCMNCGWDVYTKEHRGLCSAECRKAFEAYMEEI